MYFSGVDRVQHADLIKSEGGRVMFSPPTRLRNPKLKNFLMQNGGNVLDSGAYQGFTDVEAYADIVLESHSYLQWAVNLDAIADQDQSNRNFERLHNLLPSEVANKILWVFQTGADPAMIADYGKNKLVGIGGMVPMHRYPARIRAYLEKVSKHLSAANSKAHLFGMTNLKLLKWAAFQDWFESADSTRWMFGLKSAELITVNGDCFDSADRGLMFTPEERARHNIRVLRAIVEAPADKVQLDLFN